MISECRLWEVSATPFPAQSTARMVGETDTAAKLRKVVEGMVDSINTEMRDSRLTEINAAMRSL